MSDTVDNFNLPEVEWLVWRRGMRLPTISLDYQEDKSGSAQQSQPQQGLKSQIIKILLERIRLKWPTSGNLPDRIIATMTFAGNRKAVHPKYFDRYCAVNPLNGSISPGESQYLITDVIQGRIRIRFSQQTGPSTQPYSGWQMSSFWEPVGPGEFQSKETVTAMVVVRAKFRSNGTELKLSKESKKLRL